MSTPSVSLATLSALESALFKGVRMVAYDGGSVTYASTAEMLALRDMLRAELGLPPAASRVRPRPRRAVVNL
ncbi:phage head-tail joining protein [Cereibacter johrii]|uniref:phage head-tail joining protein n=1 Tax=Cereibacter johrii TaxID=445629 RepID=UPI00396A32E1